MNGGASAASSPAAARGARRFLTFSVDGRLYALASEEVAEVIRLPPVARVPQAPRGLLGVTNLRGTVLPVASLRGLLGNKEEDGATSAIVLGGSAPAALTVDKVEALVAIDAGRVETRPSELAARSGERLTGAFTLEDGKTVAKILDVAALIGAAFAPQPRAPRRGLAGAGHAEAAAGANDRQRKLVSFDVAGQEYALDVEAVQEILDAPDTLASMPASEELVLGVASFRDALLPLLSLRGLLGLAQTAERTGREKVVVARLGEARVGLLADRMRTIFSADPTRLEEVPPLLAARAGGEARIAAIYRGDEGRRLVSLLSPAKLFREDVMQRVAQGSGAAAAQGAGNDAVPRGEERQFVVFRLGEDEFGLPVEAVHEVAPVPEQIARLPRTPKFLEGVINLRGEVLPVVDQRRRFDMPARDADAGRRLLVVRTERHRAGLIVDSVSEVLRCPAADIEPAPNLTGEAVRLVHGVLNLDRSGRMVLLLDPAELLTRAERGLLDAFAAKTEKAAL